MFTAETLNLISAFTALLVTVMLLVATLLGENLKQKTARYFFILLLLNLMVFLLEYGIWTLEGHTGASVRLWASLFDFFCYFVAAVQYVMVALYLHAYLTTKTQSPKALVYAVGILGVGMVILAVIAQFNHMYAWFDDNNYYHQQDTFWVSLILPMIALSLCVFYVLKAINALKPKEYLTLLLYPIVAFTCCLAEVFFRGILFSYLGATLALFLMYINLQVELGLQLKEKEAELAQSRIAVMLSQIQPHFLYNSLTAISRLCYDNPKAQEALFTFADYLRTNMSSLTQKNLIPFEKELEHVKQYLLLETLRFEERLKVEYQIETDAFMVPPLTLQPIVENAVRHGITKKRMGGTVTIHAQEGPDSYLITVSDNGAGCNIEEALADGRPHLGITNVRQRLAAMCDGTLIIDSAPGKGTLATLTIPKGGSTHESDCRRR